VGSDVDRRGGRDLAANRALHHMSATARARIQARDAMRKRIDMLPKRGGGQLAAADSARRQAPANGAVVRRRRSGSPNRGPPKTKVAPEGMHGTRNTVPSRADRLSRAVGVLGQTERMV